MRSKLTVEAVLAALLLLSGVVAASAVSPAGANSTSGVAPDDGRLVYPLEVSGAPPPGRTIYLSSTTGGSVDGVVFADEDIVSYDEAEETWSMAFDGSDVGLASADVDGFTIVSLDPFVIEMSFTAGRSIPGVGLVDDSDVVRFSGIGGENTSGGFLLVVDGSDLGFSTNGEDLDAVARTGSNYVLSTLGAFNIPGLTGADEDLVSFSPTSTGSATSGVTSLQRDGSVIGLGPSDIVGASIDLAQGMEYGAALASFSIGGVTGDGDDVFTFPTVTEPAAVIFDGDLHGFGGEQIDGIHVSDGPGVGQPGSADLMVTVDDNVSLVTAGGSVDYTVTITNNGPDGAANVLLDGTLSPGLTVSAITGCAMNQQTLPCLVGSIADGQSEVLTVTAAVDPTAIGVVNFGAAVSSAVADPTATNNTASESTTVVTGPAAVDDGPADDSSAGDPFHTALNTTLTAADGSAEDLLINDDLGDPAGVLYSFGGGDLGGTAGDNFAGATVAVGDGSISLEANGSFSFTPPTGFSGPFRVNYRLSNIVGDSDARLTVFVGDRPETLVYLSSTTSGTAGGLAFADEDIVYYNTSDQTWNMLFDGSDLGLTTADVDAFHIVRLDPLEINLSLTAPRNLPGAGVVDDSDVVTFTGVGGPTTSGTFSQLVDGSDLGLSSGGEDIDAVTMSGPRHLISTVGNFNIPGGLIGSDEDLLLFIPTSLGPVTTGALSLEFDGSDVGLAPRDLTGASDDPMSDDIFGAAQGNYTVAGLSGDSDDVFAFTGTTGTTTAGTARLIFDGDLVGFGGEQIDGLHVQVGPITEN